MVLLLLLLSLKIVCGFFSEILISWVRTAHTKAMQADHFSVTEATYRKALGTCAPFEEGDKVTIVDLSISDKTFIDSEGNAVEYGKLYFTFSNGACLAGSVFRGVHKTGNKKSDTVVIRSFLATAMAKAKAVATTKFPRPDKGEVDRNAKEFNTLAILSLLRELTQNNELAADDEVTSITLQVKSAYSCVGQNNGSTYQYTAYCLDLPE